MLGKGGAGSDTTADLLAVMDAAITAVPPKHRRLMVTCDSAGASHGLITRLDELSARITHYPWLEPHKLVALEPPTTPVRRGGYLLADVPPHRLPGREAVSLRQDAGPADYLRAIHHDAEPRNFAEHGGRQNHE
ncbi:MAG: hypothetical protein WAK28_29045 [Trebonia sp.]